MSRQLQQQSQLLEQQANKVLPKILEQNEKLALEHAKEHTRQVSHNRIGLIITFGLAGISLLDNHYGFVSQLLGDPKVFRTRSEQELEIFDDADLIPYRSAEDKRLSTCLRRYHVTRDSGENFTRGVLCGVETIGYFLRSIGFTIILNEDGSFKSMNCPDDVRRRICSKAKVLFFFRCIKLTWV